MNTTTLATYSVVLTYSAMAVYVIAFISFALDMAKRAGDVGLETTRGGSASDRDDAASPRSRPSRAAPSSSSAWQQKRAGRRRQQAGRGQRGSKFERVGHGP